MYKIHCFFDLDGSERFDMWHYSVECTWKVQGERACRGLSPFKTRVAAEQWAKKQGLTLAQRN
jgi:hypothetical protein